MTGPIQTVTSAALMMSIYYLTSVPDNLRYIRKTFVADDRCDTGLPFSTGRLSGVLNEYFTDGASASVRLHNPTLGNYQRVRITVKLNGDGGLTLHDCFTVDRLVRYAISYDGLPSSDQKSYEFTKIKLVDASPAVAYVDQVADLVTVKPHVLDNVFDSRERDVAGKRFGIIVYAIRQTNVDAAEFIMISDTVNATFTLQISQTSTDTDQRVHGSTLNRLFDAAFAYILHDHCDRYVNCLLK